MTTTTTTDGRAGCDECARADREGITRRTFLRGAAAAGAAIVALPALETVTAQAAYAAGWTGDTIVVISFRGGFDGLSAVAPLGDPDYLKLRPNIGIRAAAATALDGFFGLHPGLAALKPLYDNKSLAVVHATGMPNPNRSHFDAMVEMEEAALGTAIRTGWIGRTMGLADPGGPFATVQIGSTDVPDSLRGSPSVLSMYRLRDFSIDGVGNASDRARWSAALTALHSNAPANVKAATDTTVGALATVASITATTYKPANGAVYPAGDLGDTLKDVARLIKSGVGLQAVTLDVGNWDMHAGLAPTNNPRSGWMWDQLNEVGSALAAFAKDLGPKLDSTTVITMSEFGRRAYENESNGVDHGWGNACFVLGGGVNGGKVYGTWPGLTSSQLKVTDGDVGVTTDYRAVLADVLKNRVGASVGQLATVLPGYSGGPLVGLTKAKV
jgi:uncharacterized protein (DUF1501 family)